MMQDSSNLQGKVLAIRQVKLVVVHGMCDLDTIIGDLLDDTAIMDSPLRFQSVTALVLLDEVVSEVQNDEGGKNHGNLINLCQVRI